MLQHRKYGNGTIGIVTITGGGSGYTTHLQLHLQDYQQYLLLQLQLFLLLEQSVQFILLTLVLVIQHLQQSRLLLLQHAVGNFQFNETITGGTSGATARVREWNSVTSELKISNVEGVFLRKETITGGSSNAVHTIRLIDLTNFDDGFGENDNFETEADAILDFSEGNPFGQP